MSNFKQYKRTGLSEMKPWEPSGKECELIHLITQNISISQADIDNKSPKLGDMIARNPDDHTDMWLVAKEYFEANFELADETTDVLPNGTRVQLLSRGGYTSWYTQVGSIGSVISHIPNKGDLEPCYLVELDKCAGNILMFFTHEIEVI